MKFVIIAATHSIDGVCNFYPLISKNQFLSALIVIYLQISIFKVSRSDLTDRNAASIIPTAEIKIEISDCE